MLCLLVDYRLVVRSCKKVGKRWERKKLHRWAMPDCVVFFRCPVFCVIFLFHDGTVSLLLWLQCLLVPMVCASLQWLSKTGVVTWFGLVAGPEESWQGPYDSHALRDCLPLLPAWSWPVLLLLCLPPFGKWPILDHARIWDLHGIYWWLLGVTWVWAQERLPGLPPL